MDRAVYKISISYQYSAAKELKEFRSGRPIQPLRLRLSIGTFVANSYQIRVHKSDRAAEISARKEQDKDNEKEYEKDDRDANSQLEALKRGVHNERVQNEHAMEQRIGEPVRSVIERSGGVEGRGGRR